MDKRTLKQNHLIGVRYGKLVVLAINGIESQCKCDCGTVKWVRNGNLYAGRTKSCGCGQAGPRKLGSVAEVRPLPLNTTSSSRGADDVAAARDARIARMTVVNAKGAVLPLLKYLSMENASGYSVGAQLSAARTIELLSRADAIELAKAKAVVALVELFFPRPVNLVDAQAQP